MSYGEAKPKLKNLTVILGSATDLKKSWNGSADLHLVKSHQTLWDFSKFTRENLHLEDDSEEVQEIELLPEDEE